MTARQTVKLLIVLVFVRSLLLATGASAAPMPPTVGTPVPIVVPTPTPTPLPSRQTYQLMERTGNGPAQPLSTENQGMGCNVFWNERNPSQPNGLELVGAMATVAFVNGRAYVQIEHVQATMLHCFDGLNSWTPTWIEDRDPGRPGSGDVLIMATTSERTVYVEAWASQVVYGGCGPVDVGMEWICLRLPTHVTQVYVSGWNVYRDVLVYQVPGWMLTTWAYPIEGTYTAPIGGVK